MPSATKRKVLRPRGQNLVPAAQPNTARISLVASDMRSSVNASVGVLGALPVIALVLATRVANGDPVTISSQTANVGGLSLHYLSAGHGEPVILLHGYAETAEMWRPAMEVLAQKYYVIAPDLPGIGDSDIPLDGLDMRTSAVRIRALATQLKLERVRVVGHDIGLMVAYAYAALYPRDVVKLVLMDAFLPGIGAWEGYTTDPRRWHMTFNGPTAEKLVEGRERIYFEHFWNDFAADPAHSVSEDDRVRYAQAYARPGRMRAGWAYFKSFPQTAKDFAELSKIKLAMPVLAISGARASNTFLGEQARIVATDVAVTILASTGHWVLQERPRETIDALIRFL